MFCFAAISRFVSQPTSRKYVTRWSESTCTRRVAIGRWTRKGSRGRGSFVDELRLLPQCDDQLFHSERLSGEHLAVVRQIESDMVCSLVNCHGKSAARTRKNRSLSHLRYDMQRPSEPMEGDAQ
jgi:hypothetical protein